MKKIQITESQLHNLLNESLSRTLYHISTISHAYGIVNDDTLYLTSVIGSTADNTKSKGLYYMSFTRQKSTEFGYAYKYRDNCARFEFDGEKLSFNFKGRPIDYWGESMGKQSYYSGHKKNYSFNDKQHHTSNETEDRIIHTKPYILNAHKYIKRIDILINRDNKNDMHYSYLMLHSPLFSKKIFIYDNKNEFDKQSDKIINEEFNDFSYYEKYSDNMPINSLRGLNKFKYKDLIYYALYVIFDGEVEQKNIGRETSNILKKYNLEKYINGDLINKLKNDGYFGGLRQAVNSLSDELRNLRNYPNEETANINRMVSDYFIKHNLKTFIDLYKYKSSLPYNTIDDSTKTSLTDENKKIDFLVYEEGFNRILIPEPNKTSFWDVIANKNYDKEIFIDNLYSMTRHKHNSTTDESYYKYLQHLAKNNISVNKMLSIIDKLNLDENEKEQIFNYGTFKIENLSYQESKYNYKLPKYKNISYNDYKRSSS